MCKSKCHLWGCEWKGETGGPLERQGWVEWISQRCFSDLAKPTIPVCLELSGFLGKETFCDKMKKASCQLERLVTYKTELISILPGGANVLSMICVEMCFWNLWPLLDTDVPLIFQCFQFVSCCLILKPLLRRSFPHSWLLLPMTCHDSWDSITSSFGLKH